MCNLIFFCFSFTQSRVITSTARAVKKEEEYEEQKAEIEYEAGLAVSRGPKSFSVIHGPPISNVYQRKCLAQSPQVSRGYRKHYPDSHEKYLNSLIADRSYDVEVPVFAKHVSSLDFGLDNEEVSISCFHSSIHFMVDMLATNHVFPLLLPV